MSFDYSKLKGRIIEKCGSFQAFAKAVNLSEQTISKYLNNQVPWKQTNIVKAVSVLDIRSEEIPAYFFAQEVQRIGQKKGGKA